MTGDEVVASGFVKPWVESLSDITAEEMRAIKDYIDTYMPLKQCDVLLGCEEAATWAALFHPYTQCCHLFIGCEEHAQILVTAVMEEISFLGLYVCDDCGLMFNRQDQVVRFWKV